VDRKSSARGRMSGRVELPKHGLPETLGSEQQAFQNRCEALKADIANGK
jgi:hypothetical protein